jgi:sugar/nucleoside kinase (ribokinase family)
VTVDVACGSPAFLDLTFAGLDALPGPGEERFAQALLRSPGGGAITAIGAARLGLAAALAAPLGRDPEAALLRAVLEAEGVRCAERTVEHTPVTAVLPLDGERAMASYAPPLDLRREDVAAHDPRAVVLSLPSLHCAPPGVALYATAGDDDARAHAGAPPAAVRDARALLLNEREARVLSGADDVVAAARALAAHAETVVVTRGPAGALAVENGELVEVGGVETEVVDSTGAGDLFAATYVWADLGGAPLRDRLSWGCLHAALSVRVPTAVAGAQSIVALAQAGAERGLALPPHHPSVVHEEEEGR